MYEIDSHLCYQEVKSSSADIEPAMLRQEANRHSLEKKLANKKNISISITQNLMRLNHTFQGGFLQAKCFSNSANEQRNQKEWGRGILQKRGSSQVRETVYVGVGVGSMWKFFEFNLIANAKLL